MIIAILEINLNEIKNNILKIKSTLKKEEKFCLVAKANAYGLGDKAICKYVKDCVDMFAVSSEEEFFRLKKVVQKRIILLDPVYKNITKLAKENAVFCVTNFESLNKILNIAKECSGLNFEVEIAINTGMNRFGFYKEKDILGTLEEIKKVQNISIFGVFSHYFESNNQKIVNYQRKKFLKFKKLILNNYEKKQIFFHICASGGINQRQKFDMVRVGINAYINITNTILKLKAKIIEFQILNKGESAGYNKEFIALQKTKIAIVQIGYGDGVFRRLVGKGYVLVNDKFCKIVAICMDSIMVDVTNVDCNFDSDVIIFGKDKSKQIFVCDLANWCDTIDYEILTHISSRVKRKYIKG